MAYKLNGKSYTDHALMDEVIYNAKLIIDKIILKNTRLAMEYETEDTMLQADYLLAIKNGSMMLNFFPFNIDMLLDFGYTPTKAKDIMADWKQIPVADRDKVLKFCCDRFEEEYVEKNTYYRNLMGLPEYGTDEYNIYIDPADPRLLEDDANTDFNFSAPLHEYTIHEINTLEALGIMDDIRSTYTGSNYRYLSHIVNKIDPATARAAEQWDILYIPNVEFLVKSRFKEVYAINRDIYLRRTYQDAMAYGSQYYDEMVMIMILCQTLTDLISELPEWYVRRDIFDLRSVKYFLDSQGVAFYKEIPLKYQIKIVKNLNRLIRYKSTNKNIFDILEIFRAEGTTVYKYYLFKKFLYNKDLKEAGPTPPVPEKPWEITDFESYDYGDEDTFEEIWDHSGVEREENFMCEETDIIDHSGYYRDFDFGDEDSDYVPNADETDEKIDASERDKTIYDENGNVYALEFIRVPIGESYDDYIKDMVYREEYDMVTYQDKYWDGEDVHYLVRNNHLSKDFTIEGTKYMFLDYSVSSSEYYYQMCYFMGLIFSSQIDTENIIISLPMITTEIDFSITDICIFLMCISANYLGTGLGIKTPNNVKTEQKHSFYKYRRYDGGWFYDGIKEPEPEEPDEPEDEPNWMKYYYDFGYEDEQVILYDEVYGTMYDFGYHNTIDPNKDILVYDFKEITDDSVELETPPQKKEMVIYEDDGKVNVNGSEEEIEAYLKHTKYVFQEDWNLGNLYDFGLESESGRYDKLETDGKEYADIYEESLNGSNNNVGDFTNYDFYDESENRTFMPVYYHHRMYDFNLGDPDYEPVDRPEINQKYPWWIYGDVERHAYTDFLDGEGVESPVTPNNALHYAQGGLGVRYSEVNRDSFYNWISTDNPQLFVPLAGRILGFNLTVDLEEISQNIGVRHSDFEFQHGYTLEDFGCEGFMTSKKITSIEDMLKIYRNNTECYNNLSKHMEEENDTRDKVVVMNYIFNSLFTTPFDTSFYRLKSGMIASDYTEILQERNLILYKYYKKIMEEKDIEIRKDTMRDLLNQIVDILEYYFGTDDLKYTFSWIPTNSLDAITKYIKLLINFFKSWKVYFLEPHVTFRLDDKKENRIGVGDQIVETKIDQWVGDSLLPMDGMNITIHRYFVENNIYAVHKEVVDIMAYHQPDITRDNIFDGRYVTLTKEEKQDTIIANGGEADYLSAVPFIKADGGNVAARDDIYEFNGAGSMDMKIYLTADGGRVGNVHNNSQVFPAIPRDENNFIVIDGGTVTETLTASYTMSSFVNDFYELVHHVILSGKKRNNIEIRPDGIYLGDTFVTTEGLERFKEQMDQEIKDYRIIADEILAKIKEIPTMEVVEEMIVENFAELLKNPLAVLDEYQNQDIKKEINKYTDERVKDLVIWFNTMIPFEDWYFEKEEVETEP